MTKARRRGWFFSNSVAPLPLIPPKCGACTTAGARQTLGSSCDAKQANQQVSFVDDALRRRRRADKVKVVVLLLLLLHRNHLIRWSKVAKENHHKKLSPIFRASTNLLQMVRWEALPFARNEEPFVSKISIFLAASFLTLTKVKDCKIVRTSNLCVLLNSWFQFPVFDGGQVACQPFSSTTLMQSCNWSKINRGRCVRQSTFRPEIISVLRLLRWWRIDLSQLTFKTSIYLSLWIIALKHFFDDVPSTQFLLFLTTFWRF